MKLKFIRLIVISSFVLACLHQTSSTEIKKALEINTDASHYKKLQEHKPLELTCKNNVAPSMSVKWKPPKSVTTDMYNLSVIEDKKLYTLTIDEPNRKHAGLYTCISYTNEGHEITESVDVIVLPVIEKLLVNGAETYNNQEVPITGNGPVVLKCIYDQYTYNQPTYEWKKDDVTIDGQNSDTLTVKEIGTSTYGCIVRNSFNHVQRNIKIKILRLSSGGECIAANVCLVIILLGSLFFSVTSIKKRWQHRKIIAPTTCILTLLICFLVPAQNILGWNFTSLCITEISVFVVFVLLLIICIIYHKFYQDSKFSTTKLESDIEVGPSKENEEVILLTQHPDEPQSLKKQEKEVHVNNKITRPKENKQNKNYEDCSEQNFVSLRSDDI